MEEGPMALSTRDRDRLKVLSDAKKGRITQKQAGQHLDVTERQIRRMVTRMREQGDRSILHGLRGQPSNRRMPEAAKQQALSLLSTKKYADFGPTLASEYLGKKRGLWIGKETVRKWMTEAGLWRVHPAKIEKVHQWRKRRACFGELVQWDTSEHDWLEGRGEKLYLIKMIDDATSRLFCRFVRHDSTEENMRLLQSYLERYGRPLAFYTDKAALFANTPKSKNGEMPREGETPPTQIGRALQELGIEWNPAHSPQAKGRVERSFGTDQDRLVKGLRIAGAATLEQANAYVENEYIPEWEARFTREPVKATDAHRPLDKSHRLDSILSYIEQRVVANDYTVRYGSLTWQIARADVRPGLRGARVMVGQRWDGAMAVRFGGRQGRKPGCAASSWRKRQPFGSSSKTNLATGEPNEGKRTAGQGRPGYLRVFLSRASARRLHPSNALANSKTNPTARSWRVGLLHPLTLRFVPLLANRTFLCGP